MTAEAPAPRHRAAALLLGVAILAALLWANRALLGAELFETSDFAANSLLVQDAKRLELLTGNYSRIGFHHPGPAILYVLAAGEYLFHDLLQWVRSPIAGQLVAGLAWNAAWCAALFSLLAAILGSASAGLRAVAVFVAVTALRNGQLLESIWMPSLYYMPFAVLMAALARLASGHFDRLALLVLSAGFLVHGHAAFLVMVPPMAAFALAVGGVVLARRGRGRAALRSELRSSRADAITAAVIALAFLLPPAIETARAFPGPLAAYLGYGGETRPNALRPAVGFVVRYWGSLVAFGGAIVVLAAFAWGPGRLRERWRRESALGVAASFAAASAMVLVYAKYGVDDLGHWYVGMFYTSASIIVESIAAALLLGLVPVAAAWVNLAASGAALAAVVAWLTPAGLLTSPAVPELAQRLAGFPRPTVLDLDNRVDEGGLWSSVLGATAYLARREGVPYCIRRNWHVSYTHALRCTAEQEQQGHIVTAASARGAPLPPPVHVADGVAVAATPPPALAWGTPLPTHAAAVRPGLLGQGWSHPEDSFTWTVGRQATLTFVAPQRSGFVLELEMLAFLPGPASRQVVSIAVNGRQLESLELAAPAQWQRVRLQVPAPLVEGPPHVVVSLHVARPMSPRAAKVSDDARMLGIALKQLAIHPLP